MRALRAMLVLTHRGVYRRSAGAIKTLRRSLPLSATVVVWRWFGCPGSRKNRFGAFAGIWGSLPSGPSQGGELAEGSRSREGRERGRCSVHVYELSWPVGNRFIPLEVTRSDDRPDG